MSDALQRYGVILLMLLWYVFSAAGRGAVFFL